jgi:hypothetical protein
MFTEGALRPWEVLMRDPIGRQPKAQNLPWRFSGRASTLKINGVEVARKPRTVKNTRSTSVRRTTAPVERTFDNNARLEISRGIRANLAI